MVAELVTSFLPSQTLEPPDLWRLSSLTLCNFFTGRSSFLSSVKGEGPLEGKEGAYLESQCSAEVDGSPG